MSLLAWGGGRHEVEDFCKVLPSCRPHLDYAYPSLPALSHGLNGSGTISPAGLLELLGKGLSPCLQLLIPFCCWQASLPSLPAS